MVQFGEEWAQHLRAGDLVFLNGDLGAGKTTFVKGLLKGLGFSGSVTSPTYTLVEPYQINQLNIFHFDLYRLKSAEELEMIGVREMITPENISLIEWPEKGKGVLPDANYQINIEYADPGRVVVIHGYV